MKGIAPERCTSAEAMDLGGGGRHLGWAGEGSEREGGGDRSGDDKLGGGGDGGREADDRD